MPSLTARLVQANRSQNSIGRSGSTATGSSVGSSSRAAPPSNPPFKKAPPPPPGASSHPPPPPYTPSSSGNAASAAAAAKRAPPPPPPLKPKPKIIPQVQYVIALYDFAAQVRFATSRHIDVFYHGITGRGRLVFQHWRPDRNCGEDRKYRRLVDWTA